MGTINSVEELDELMNTMARDSKWGVIIGNYRKLKNEEDLVQKVKLLYSVLKNLKSRGYEINKKVVIQLLS